MSFYSTAEKVGSTMYDGTAQLGRFQATVSLGAGVVFAVCLASVVSSLIASIVQQPALEKTSGIIKDAKCSTRTVIVRDKYNNSSQKYITECMSQIEYIVDNKKYKQDLLLTGRTYNVNETVTIYYEKNHPENIYESNVNFVIAIAIVVTVSIAVLVLVGVYLNYYATTNYKILAAAQGTSTVGRTIGSIFN